MSFSAINRATNVAKKVKPEKLSKFVDSLKVKFQGGRGGDGCISMLSLFANELAGPDGGNGGHGGHVILSASSRVKSLNKIAKIYKAQDGERGRGKCQFGSNGNHTFVEVPVGTIVAQAPPKNLPDHEYDPNSYTTLAQLDHENTHFIAARGGSGGRGNASYLSNQNRHPRIAESGAQGEINELELRLRIYAHVGLIGLPNAGKSTLLKTLTHAKVKIGNYAFTTLYPQVGIVEFEDYTQIAVSDLPGLIEDSHKNRGLGVRFLRNVQRCICLLYVVDMVDDPVRDFEILINELDSFRAGMSRRPSIVMGNKIDDPRSSANIAKFTQYLKESRPEVKFLACSAERGDNLELVRLELRRMYDQYQASDHGDGTPYIWSDGNKF